MAEKYDLVARPEKDSKVEIYLNNPEPVMMDDSEGEISLMNVFAYMKKARGFFAWITIVCMIVGVLVPYVAGLMGSPAESVSAVITFHYDGAENLKAPDGSELDVGFIMSSYVLSDAVRSTHLSKDVSINSVSQNMKVSRMLSEDTQKMMEILQKMDGSSPNADDPSKYISAVKDVEYTYKNQYIITLNNGFSTGGANSKKVYLNGAELALLLNNTIDVYRKYFFETYDSFRLPDNTIEDISLDELDYIEWLDNMYTVLDSLSDYCADEGKGTYLQFRSETNGLSFNDIRKMIQLVRSTRVDYLYSYVYYNYLAKDKDRLVTKFNYSLRSLNHDLNTVNSNITDGATLIENYKNNNILLNRRATDEGDDKDLSAKSVTDYYNNLIMKQSGLYTQKATISTKIDNLQKKITGFSRSSGTASKMALVDQEIKEVNDICREIYDLVKNLAVEISESETYKSSFITTIDASYYGGFFSDNGKKIAIGCAAGLFLGLAAWFVYGFAKELKESSRKAEA